MEDLVVVSGDDPCEDGCRVGPPDALQQMTCVECGAVWRRPDESRVAIVPPKSTERNQR